MSGSGGTVRGPRVMRGVAFFGIVLMASAAMAGQLVAVLPPRRFGLVEYTTGAALLGGVALVMLSTHALSLRLERAMTNALEIERAEELAQTEPKTGLLNRPGLEQVVEKMRGRRSFVVLAFELEGLTTLHDDRDHEASDELICRFADVARSQIRRSDVFAFIGGHEFLVVLFDAVAVDAEALAFRVVNAASEHSVGGLPIRVSIGIATGGPSDLFDDVVRRADAGLEIATQDGGGTDFAGAETPGRTGLVDRRNLSNSV